MPLKCHPEVCPTFWGKPLFAFYGGMMDYRQPRQSRFFFNCMAKEKTAQTPNLENAQNNLLTDYIFYVCFIEGSVFSSVPESQLYIASTEELKADCFIRRNNGAFNKNFHCYIRQPLTAVIVTHRKREKINSRLKLFLRQTHFQCIFYSGLYLFEFRFH